jgi:tetratricopeptide (TPR) repeat protein
MRLNLSNPAVIFSPFDLQKLRGPIIYESSFVQIAPVLAGRMLRLAERSLTFRMLQEVATMTHNSFIKSVRITAQSLLMGVVLVAGFGCAETDTVTFAKNANRDGMALYQDSNYLDASVAFKSATRQNPRDYNSFYYLGLCYHQLGSNQEEIAAFRACLDVMPLSLAGKQDTAMRYKAMDSLAMAIAKSATCGQETADMEAKCAGKAAVDDQWMLAKIYRFSGDADAAIEAYNKAVLIDSTRFDIAKEAGLYEAALGQNDKAAATLKKAYAQKSDDDQVNDALHRLGVVTGTGLREESPFAHLY